MNGCRTATQDVNTMNLVKATEKNGCGAQLHLYVTKKNVQVRKVY